MLWNIQPFHKDAKVFAGEIGKDELLAHLLLSRGVDTKDKVEDFLLPDYETHLHNPFLFRDLEKIVDRVRRAKDDGEVVGVFGDYDADGVTGSATLREALEGLDIKVVVHIPDKHKEGHGLSVEGIDTFQKAGVKLFFTVDCGITNKEEVDIARERGLECIIIDHHHVPEIMPHALAIVNPKVPDCGYPFADLCGAGTAFKVAQGLYQRLAPEKMEQLKWLLDIVAIGTVADCMPLVDENRVFVRFGSVVLAKTRRVGLQEMYALGRIPIDSSRHPDAMTIAFQIAPRINAASRMAHARIAHDLVMEKNREEAFRLAKELESHNNERRKLSDKVTNAVKKRVKKECEHTNTIVMAHESYPLGIVGLIAGKIAEEFQKPTVILTKGEKVSQGSLRTAKGIHLAKILEELEDILEKFGGHEQAAGLTLKNENLEEFTRRFEDVVTRESGKNTTPKKEKNIDAELLCHHLEKDFLSEIKQLEPFGLGNPEPVFLLRNAVVVEKRLLGNGNKHLKLKLRIGEEGKTLDAIGFSLGENFGDIERGEMISLVGKFQENVWNGNVSLQIMIEDIRRNI
jgi:single-stranded-DNA-specific exonuclease